MTVPDATPDALALAEVIDLSPLRCPHGSPEFCGLCIAQHVLASSWLVQRDARVRAEAAVGALSSAKRLAVRCYPPSLVSTATVVADLDQAIVRIERGESR